MISTGYDKDGNLSSFTDGGGKITYVYDAANRMTQLIEPDGVTTTVYGYDKADRKKSIQYPNGTGMLITYDNAGHVKTSLGGVMNGQGQITTPYSSFSYKYTNGTSHMGLLQEVDELDPVGQSVTSDRT